MAGRQPGFFERRRMRKAQEQARVSLDSFCEAFGIQRGLAPNQIKSEIAKIPDAHRRGIAQMKFEMLFKKR